MVCLREVMIGFAVFFRRDSMPVCFKIFETQLEFHDDLKKYYALSCEFQAAHDKAHKTVRGSFIARKEPAEIFQSIEAVTKQFVGDLINRLSNYGVFDRAASDYLNTNNGYLQLLNATTAYYEYTKNTTERNHAIAEASKESANASINSSISGLDFGIISSSIIDHAVYAAMNNAEIRKQSAAAFDRYCAVCNVINANRDSKITEEISEYYINQYVPAITAALAALYGHLLSTYTTDLNTCGQLDLDCLEHIDLQRSNEIVNNIDNIDNKQGVFLKAIELCPYNINAYLKGYSAYLYPQGLSVNDVCGDLIKYFNLEKALSNILVSASSLCDKAKEYLIKDDYYKAKKTYEEIASTYPQKHFGWLGLLLCETKKFTHTTPDMCIVENYYSKAINALDDNDLRNTLKSRFDNYKYNVTRYAKLLKEREEITHQEAVTQSVLEVAQKDRSKWSILTILFGIISAFVLIVCFLAPSGIGLLLVSGGATAATGYMLNDSKKRIEECENKNSKRSEKEKEISELRSVIINTASIENIL